jgi:hypothetical protein
MKFDLMKDKPRVDVPTLNWVWDTLWRRHACMKPKNATMRTRMREIEILMEDLEHEAKQAEAAPIIGHREDAYTDAEGKTHHRDS